MSEENEVMIKDAVDPVSLETSKTILDQMENCVCKIHVGKKKGTGFFMKIPYKNKELNVLITNNHVLNDEKLEKGKNVTFSLNNEKTTINLNIDDTMKRYTNEILDITIIELKENDKINKFLELDKQILDLIDSKNYDNSEYINNLYENNSIYILNYIEEIFVSYGLLTKVKGDKITHKCSTDDGSSGSPILLLKTNKVIGVHYGGSKHNLDYNFGTLLVKSIIEFQTITNNLLVIKGNKSTNNSTIITDSNNPKFSNINLISHNLNNNDNSNIDINLNETIPINSFETHANISFSNISMEKDTQVNTNNLSNNQDNNYHSSLFKHLIRFVYFKREFNLLNNSFQNKLHEGYLINAKIINKLKQKYNINDIIPNLDNNILEGITYKNVDNNFYKISEFLEDCGNSTSYIFEQSEFDGELQFTEDEKSLKPKKLNIPVNLNYLDDFEIIDKNFMIFLKTNFDNIIMPLIQFGQFKGNSIFTAINFKGQYFYQIMNLNNINELSFKYLIEVVKNNEFKNKSQSTDYIFGILLKNELKNLISKGNPICCRKNNFIFNLYSNSFSPNEQKNRNIKNQKNYSVVTLNTDVNND